LLELQACESFEQIALEHGDAGLGALARGIASRELDTSVSQIARPDASVGNIERDRACKIAGAAAHVDDPRRGEVCSAQCFNRGPAKQLRLRPGHQRAGSNLQFDSHELRTSSLVSLGYIDRLAHRIHTSRVTSSLSAVQPDLRLFSWAARCRPLQTAGERRPDLSVQMFPRRAQPFQHTLWSEAGPPLAWS